MTAVAKRKYLTEKERVAMYESQGGKCARCGNAFEGGRCIAEHWTPVALGNAAKPDCLLCRPCAARKTNGSPATSYGSDSHAIAKDKRLRGITKTGPKKRIPSRPFQKRTMPYQWGSKSRLADTQGGTE
jgi:hypothetical protein